MSIVSLVITGLTGGLGNQMFQYAAGRRLSLKTEARLKLDISHFAQDPRRAYELDVFNIQAAIASAAEIAALRGDRTRAGKIMHRLGLVRNSTLFREKSLEFDPSVLERTGDTYLEGYWGYEKYFQDVSDQIRQDFTFRIPPGQANDELAAQIRNSVSVCVHVRRGDFVHNPNIRQRLGFCQLAYYEQAINEIVQEVSNPHLYFFSDEPEWVQSSFRPVQPFTIVRGNGRFGYEDLRLMTLCKHHVLSNSTFGWWGAWLANHPEQIVIAPFPWTQIPSLRGKDLLPATWRTRPITGANG